MDTLGYIRVSTEQQTGEDRTSLSEQRRAINAHAEKLGRIVTDAAIFADPGVSGATAHGRPGFVAMIAFCESHARASRDGVILVLNDSRFGRFRDMREAGHWQFVLAELGWEVRFCEGDEIPDGMARNVMRLVGSGAATEYRENLRKTQRRASRAVAETGRWRCEAPLGYRRLATRKDGAQRLLEIGQRKADDEIVRLALGPQEEQELVRWMFETYASGSMSLWHLANAAQDRAPGLRTWKTQVVRSMLVNPAYVGDVVHGRRPATEDGAQRVDRDESHWLVVPNTHPAIISRELFEAVQGMLREHHARGRSANGSYMLTGLLYCSCGERYQGGGGSRGPAHDPGRWLFYRCAGANRQVGTCRPPLVCVNQRWIEGIVVECISDVVTHPSTIELIRESAYQMAHRERSGGPERRDVLRKERDRLVTQRKRLVDTIARGMVEESEASASLSEIRGRLVSVEAEQLRIQNARQAASNMEAEAEQIIQQALDFPKMAKVVPPSTLRRLIAPWIGRMVVEKDSRTLTLTMNRVPENCNIMDHTHSPELASRISGTVGRYTERQFEVPRRGRKIDHVAGGAA